ncbi:hypothetical protein [Clostridium aciditolerans]|uniref:Uncharacterized protein n=1 Tax=Clostridium aciditolerans TaxID=339861 RepID=A0A934M786_9CLOT|nr:hypothetical protein [Clostridium aciditolerans]MBI6873736.1 hypothetical protein [Clostridium aciditolerans]
MNSLINIKDLTDLYITDVKKANILPIELVCKVESMLPELKHSMTTQTIWRTETEIRCSVLNDKDCPDKASKYHQAKLEQTVFFEQLLQLSFEYRKKQQELNIKEAEIEEIEDKLTGNLKLYEVKKLEAELNIKEIEKQELIYGLKNMQIQGKERVRELETWSKIKAELDDGSFDKDNKDSNQLVSMTRRYIQEAFNVTHMGNQSDTAGYNNIIAQFYSLCKECIARKKMDEALSYFGDSQIAEWVVQVFNLRDDK